MGVHIATALSVYVLYIMLLNGVTPSVISNNTSTRAPLCLDLEKKEMTFAYFNAIFNPMTLMISRGYVEQMTGWNIKWRNIITGGKGIVMLDEEEVCGIVDIGIV